MSFSKQQKKMLKAHAHNLKPVILLGQNGLTETVLDEIELCLNHHELIKVKITADSRDEKKETIEKIAELTQSELIQAIGFVAVFFRENPEKKRYT